MDHQTISRRSPGSHSRPPEEAYPVCAQLVSQTTQDRSVAMHMVRRSLLLQTIFIENIGNAEMQTRRCRGITRGRKLLHQGRGRREKERAHKTNGAVANHGHTSSIRKRQEKRERCPRIPLKVRYIWSGREARRAHPQPSGVY